MGALAAILARVAGFGVVNLAAKQPAFTPLIYLVPLGVSAICATMIAGIRYDQIWRRFTNWLADMPIIGSAIR